MLAFCLVVAGARPSEAQVREQQDTQLVAAPHAVVASSLARRIGVDAHARPLLAVVPTLVVDRSPPVVPVVLQQQQIGGSPLCRLVSTRSSRGPPRS